MPELSSDAQVFLLCPGQGAQAVGMGQAWCQASSAARETFEQAEAMLGWNLRQYCFEGPEDQLNRTDIAQVAIYVTSVACWRAQVDGGTAGTVRGAGGLSLGEFTALHLGGAFAFEEGLRLVQLRGQAMQEAAQASSSGMVAVMGASEAEARELCEAVAQGQVLVPANFNAPGQVVLSGESDAVARAASLAGERGFKATVLSVAGAFHSPLMQPAAERLAAALEEVAWDEPAVPVLSNVTGGAHTNDVASIKRRLVEQLTEPVRWADCMSHALEAYGDCEFVELAPGKVLSGLMRRIERRRKVVNCAEPG